MSTSDNAYELLPLNQLPTDSFEELYGRFRQTYIEYEGSFTRTMNSSRDANGDPGLVLMYINNGTQTCVSYANLVDKASAIRLYPGFRVLNNHMPAYLTYNRQRRYKYSFDERSFDAALLYPGDSPGITNQPYMVHPDTGFFSIKTLNKLLTPTHYDVEEAIHRCSDGKDSILNNDFAFIRKELYYRHLNVGIMDLAAKRIRPHQHILPFLMNNPFFQQLPVTY